MADKGGQLLAHLQILSRHLVRAAEDRTIDAVRDYFVKERARDGLKGELLRRHAGLTFLFRFRQVNPRGSFLTVNLSLSERRQKQWQSTTFRPTALSVGTNFPLTISKPPSSSTPSCSVGRCTNRRRRACPTSRSKQAGGTSAACINSRPKRAARCRHIGWLMSRWTTWTAWRRALNHLAARSLGRRWTFPTSAASPASTIRPAQPSRSSR